MPEITFTFGDVRTGAIIAEIPMYGVSMSRGFGLGEMRASFQFDMTGQDNATLKQATTPGRNYIVVEREGVCIWDGIVWTRTYQSQAKVASLYCKSFEHYPERRIMRTTTEYDNIEQRNIFRDLWSDMQADPNSIQVTLPSSFATVAPIDFEIKSSEFKSYRSAMDEIASVDGGFDWTIDTSRVDGVYVRTLRIGYPQLGTTDADSAVIFDYPGNITNYWENASMTSHGTHIYGIGSGEGSTIMVASVFHTDLLSAGFPRYDQDISMKSIRKLSTLQAATIQQARIRKAPGTVITAEIKADVEPVFGSYGLGDLAKIYFNDPLHTPKSVFTSRVLGWEYYPPSNDSIEMARLVFEGEDL